MSFVNGVTNPTVAHLDSQSVLGVCGKSQQAMIYGYTHCGYGVLCQKLSAPDSPLKKMYDCTMGNHQYQYKTLEGRLIQQIDAEISDLPDTDEGNVKMCSRMCKAGITNLVLENYKRAKEGMDIIPVIFCIDSENLPLDSVRIASKDEKLNHLLTNQELRRSYKLCWELGDKEIEKIANATFKFVSLQKVDENSYKLVQNHPFWERNPAAWQNAWKERKQMSGSKKDDPFWKTQLHAAVNQYRKHAVL